MTKPRIICAIFIIVCLFIALKIELIARLNSAQTVSLDLSSQVLPDDAGVGCATTTGEIARGVFGINMIPTNSRGVQPVAEIGVRWVRLTINWAYVEPKDGEYHFESTDGDFSLFARGNIALEVSINSIPGWAKKMDSTRSAEAYATFVKRVVERYKPHGTFAVQDHWGDYGVSYWEISNEPNLPGYGWYDRSSKPETLLARYALTLVSANKVIRATDPSAVIILGGLSPDGFSAQSFLRYLYRQKLRKCFDVIAFHPYGYGGRFTEAKKLLTDVLDEFADRKPIWFNEVGDANTTLAPQLLTQIWNDRAVVDAVFWFSLVDLGSDRYGLLDSNFIKRPIAEQLKGYLRTASQ